MAAAIFSMEVISIGVMYYAALVPCVFSAFTAAALARFWGLMPEQFAIGVVPAWSIETAIVAVGLAAGCALVSELFCIALHTTEHLYKKYLPSPVWRILSGAAIVIVLTLLTGSTRYNGSGVSLIEKCFEGEGLPWDFLIKILFTTVTLEAGFKGGEIVPTPDDRRGVWQFLCVSLWTAGRSYDRLRYAGTLRGSHKLPDLNASAGL